MLRFSGNFRIEYILDSVWVQYLRGTSSLPFSFWEATRNMATNSPSFGHYPVPATTLSIQFQNKNPKLPADPLAIVAVVLGKGFIPTASCTEEGRILSRLRRLRLSRRDTTSIRRLIMSVGHAGRNLGHSQSFWSLRSFWTVCEDPKIHRTKT